MGSCPVCFDSGIIAPLRSLNSQDIIYHCPMCGTAWLVPPTGGRLDEINDLNELAPLGVELPSAEDVRLLLSAGHALVEIDYETWKDYLVLGRKS